MHELSKMSEHQKGSDVENLMKTLGRKGPLERKRGQDLEGTSSYFVFCPLVSLVFPLAWSLGADSKERLSFRSQFQSRLEHLLTTAISELITYLHSLPWKDLL